MSSSDKKDLDLWKKYGRYLFRTQEFTDFFVSHAKGTKVYTKNRKPLLDFSSGQFCSIVGHSHPQLLKRLGAQAKKVLHTGSSFLTPSVPKAASLIASKTPQGLDKVIFLSTGTEANECALHIAGFYTGKWKAVGFDLGYSGVSVATRQIGSSLLDHCTSENRKNIPQIRTPTNDDTYPFPDLIKSEKTIGKHWKDIGAIIVEPILSHGGIVTPPPGYLKELKRIARKHNALLIVDESQTGFGRTGTWFGIEHHGVVPDIITFSKTAGGGYPVSGVVTSEKIERRVVLNGFCSISSHQNDPLQAEAVSTVIDVIEKENLLKSSQKLGMYLLSGLQKIQQSNSLISDVRGIGLMVGFEIKHPSKNFYSPTSLGMRLKQECLKRGLHLNYGAPGKAFFRLYPPLTVTKKEIDQALSILQEALHAIKKKKSIPSSKNPYARSRMKKSLKERLTFF